LQQKTRAGCHFPTNHIWFPFSSHFAPVDLCEEVLVAEEGKQLHLTMEKVTFLVVEICSSNWTISSPKRGKKSKGLKPTSRFSEFPQNESVKKAWNRSSKGGVIRPI